jgi:hypothetical protein
MSGASLGVKTWEISLYERIRRSFFYMLMLPQRRRLRA